MAEFRAMFGGDEAAFRESPAAARANGFVAGAGDPQELSAVIEDLGLSAQGRARLLSMAGEVPGGACCPR